MSEEWIGSLERAVEVTEGQIALARAVGAANIGMALEIAEKLLDAARSELARTIYKGEG